MAACSVDNILEKPLVERDKIIYFPLHAKFGLIKQFVKALDKNLKYFKYICSVFADLMIEKLKARVFDGSQINKILKDTNFVKILNEN